MSYDPAQDPALESNQPDFIRAEVDDMIERAITGHPRSQQRRIGPSELGTQCDIALAHKLHGDEEPPRQPAWKPTVGTACHAWAEKAVKAADPDGARWITERRIVVGDVNGQPIDGSCDLFDWMSGTIIDFKFLGKNALTEMRRKGAKDIYRTQVQLYGRGYSLAGYHVNNVMVLAYPRDGELTQKVAWSAAYDEQVAIDALGRATAISQLIDVIGIDAVCAAYTPCDDQWCAWCAPRRYSTTPQKPTPTAALFA